MPEQNSPEITPDGKEILQKIPFRGAAKFIADNLGNSHRTTIGSSSFIRVDCSRVVAVKEAFQQKGQKVSYTDILVKLTAEALKENPFMNASLLDMEVQIYKSIHIGVAMPSKDGTLYVPVIRNADQKNLPEISAEMKGFIDKIAGRTLKPEEMSGATFTVSSLGMYEVSAFFPIINLPQAAILGMGTIKKEPVVDENDNIVIRHMAYITTTIDHRILDGAKTSTFYGALAAKFRQADRILL